CARVRDAHRVGLGDPSQMIRRPGEGQRTPAHAEYDIDWGRRRSVNNSQDAVGEAVGKTWPRRTQNTCEGSIVRHRAEKREYITRNQRCRVRRNIGNNQRTAIVHRATTSNKIAYRRAAVLADAQGGLTLYRQIIVD